MIPKGILPSDLEDSAFIAGGYAACPPLAKDLDLWVFVDERVQTLADVRQQILTWLDTEMWPYEEEGGMRQEFGQVNNYPVSSRKVAVVRSPHMTHPVHILVTNSQPADLLETFDISTHQVAIVFGNVIKGSQWTPVTEPPRMLKNTPTTPERMEKIAARFGYSLTPQGVR